MPNPSYRELLRLAYYAGLRVSELAGLCWRDLVEREDSGGQITVFGKGGKTRAILLPAAIWGPLAAMRGAAALAAPVFPGRGGRPLDESTIWRIVRRAAKAAGLQGKVSPHWLRHCHASHALDRHAPIHLVAATLGHASVATTGRYLHIKPTESSTRFLAV